MRRSASPLVTGASVLGEAARSLALHPLRSLLTVASVGSGAAVLVVLLSYASGVPDATTSILRSLGGKEFLAEPGRSRGGGGGNRRGRRIRIRYVDMPAIREACPSIEGMAPTYDPGRGGPVFAADRSWPWARLTGVGHDYRRVTELNVAYGRWFTRAEEVNAEEVALASLPLVESMYDGRAPLGETIDARGRRFEIIGVFESEASFSYSLLVPYPTAMAMGDDGGRFVSQIAFAPRRPDLAREAVLEIRRALGSLYSFDPRDESALEVEENIAFVERVEATAIALETLLVTIAVVALALGSLGAANVVGISVAERTSELGLRRALGATARRVRLEVLTETLFLSLLGGALGLVLGSLAATALGPLEFTAQTTLVPRADTPLLALSLPVLVLTAALAALPAANRAARVDPAVTMRDE